MIYQVVLINGGEYSNIEAPLMVEANNLSSLEDEIKACFELPSADLMVVYCGQLLKPTGRLPRDGALLQVSVKPTPPPSFSLEGINEPPFKAEINDAFQFVQMHQRRPTKERLRLIIEELLEKRYEMHPKLCREDLYGARLCSNYALFMASLKVKVMRHHEIIQTILLEIHKVGRVLLERVLPPSPQASPTPPSRPLTNPPRPPLGFPQSIVPLIQSANGQPTAIMPPMNVLAGSTGPVFTSEMLTQALNAAQQHMTQTGQTLQAQLPENQNIQQAAHDVLSEVAALADLVERGIAQLREMGILGYTTEQNARLILQENGGNVDAAANQIFEHLADFQ